MVHHAEKLNILTKKYNIVPQKHSGYASVTSSVTTTSILCIWLNKKRYAARFNDTIKQDTIQYINTKTNQFWKFWWPRICDNHFLFRYPPCINLFQGLDCCKAFRRLAVTANQHSFWVQEIIDSWAFGQELWIRKNLQTVIQNVQFMENYSCVCIHVCSAHKTITK